MADTLRIVEGENIGRPCLIFQSFNRAYHLYDDDVRKEDFCPYSIASAILYIFNGHFVSHEYQYVKDTIMAAVVTRKQSLDS